MNERKNPQKCLLSLVIIVRPFTLLVWNAGVKSCTAYLDIDRERVFGTYHLSIYFFYLKVVALPISLVLHPIVILLFVYTQSDDLLNFTGGFMVVMVVF